MGGGIFTALALTLVFTIGWLPVFLISLFFTVVWGAIAFWIIRNNRKENA